MKLKSIFEKYEIEIMEITIVSAAVLLFLTTKKLDVELWYVIILVSILALVVGFGIAIILILMISKFLPNKK